MPKTSNLKQLANRLEKSPKYRLFSKRVDLFDRKVKTILKKDIGNDEKQFLITDLFIDSCVE